MRRRLDIDWLRGLAVLFMIMWHAIDAWTVQQGRDSAAFLAIAFAAGWVAPLFLFLAGVSLPFAGLSRVERGLNRREASWTLQKRGWQVLLIAHLFRLQSFLLNPSGSWNTILKPDILNVLGLGMVAVALCWRASDRSWRAITTWLLLPALAIAAIVTPWSRTWWWPTLLHPRLEAYIRPVGANGVFSLFPAVAYTFAGAFVGALMADRGPRGPRFYGGLAVAGAAILVAGLAASASPWARSPWVDAPAVFLWRCGTIAIAVAGTWLAFRTRTPLGARPLVLFGQTSLFVYWVHVEVAYGIFSYPIHHALTLPWSFAAYVLLTCLMYGAARAWQARRRGPLIPAHMVAPRDDRRRWPGAPAGPASWTPFGP